jgi:ribosome maturation factor RimP
VGVSPTFLLWGVFVGVELDQIRQIVEEIVESEAYELVDLELNGAGKHRVLQLFIDKEDGITHGDCQLISEQVGTVLDVEDLIPQAYTLEVSSPGLDRKLLKNSDFTRFEGHLVKIRTRIPLHNQKVFRGRLEGLADDRIQLASLGGEVVEIPMDVVHEARLEIDWETEKSRSSRSR